MTRGSVKRSAVAMAAVMSVLAGSAARVWADEPPNPTCGHAKAMRSMWAAGQGGTPELPWVRQIMRESMVQTDVLHNNLDIEVLPATKTVQGSNTMTVKSLVDGLTQFSFRLRNNMTISQCVLKGGVVVPCQTIGATGRVVTLDRAYNVGEEFTLKVIYSGRPGEVDDAITFSTTSDGLPNIFTLSEPFGASAWWPCKDVDYGQPGDNSDKATLDLAVTVPGTISVVSNGLPVGVEDLSGARKRYRWATSYPLATYLVCFSAANYASWSKVFQYAGEEMPVIFNLYVPGDSVNKRAGAERVVGMLRTLSDLYGVYPFMDEKYGIYEFGWGGGMEHQTNTGQCCFNSDWLTVHELGHQWWGDNVTCKTWGDIWLNEGFATYTEALWEEFKPGSSGAAALKSAMNNRRSSGSGSVYRYDTSSFGSIFSSEYAYNKGGWVLHMLRGVVGDHAFFDTLAAYRNAYTGGAATTNDFAAVASAVSGRDLTRFFDQWVFKNGLVGYSYGFQNITVAGKAYVRVHLRQTQSTSFGADGMFQMPVTVRLGPAAGAPRARVENTARLQHYLLPVGFSVSAIMPDPDDYILCTKGSEAYRAGPPKLVAAAPAPGAEVVLASAPDRVTLNFSDNITAAASDFVVAGPGGSVPFTLAYDPPTWTAVLSFANPLPAGAYTVSVADSVKSAGGMQLDGEIADPASAASLPSGDGLPAGGAVFAFSVLPSACAADINGDGLVHFADYLEFLNRYDAGDLSIDFTHDGIIDVNDYLEFLNLYEAGC